MKKIGVIILMVILNFHGNSQTSVALDWSGRHCSGGIGFCGIELPNDENRAWLC